MYNNNEKIKDKDDKEEFLTKGVADLRYFRVLEVNFWSTDSDIVK